MRRRLIWLCLPVVSDDLEEAEAPSAVICNMSRALGHCLVIQYYFLSSPFSNGQGRSGAVSGKVREGERYFFCVSVLVL